MRPVLEDPFYYLVNFQFVLDWISARYPDLLDENETAFLNEFPTLPQSSRALFVRMVMRKGSVFRASKLNYVEIGATHVAAEALLEKGWVESDPTLELGELCDLLHKHELADCFALSSTERSLRKSEQIDLLHQTVTPANAAQAFSAWCPTIDDALYRINNKELCERFRLMFFGNFHQDWSEFILANLGLYLYEQVSFSSDSRGFQTRRDVDDYLRLQQCRKQLDEGDDPSALLSALNAISTDNPWLASRRQKLLFLLGQQLEKAKRWPDALAIYSACTYPQSRVRAIRVLEKAGDKDGAMQRLTLAQNSTEDEAEHQHLQRIAPRLHRQLGLTKPASTPKIKVVELHLRLPFPEDPAYIEEVVRSHLHREDAPTFYVENALINSLFGLLCWPAIFAPVPGAFFHPFHRSPADLQSADFHQRRSDQINRCLALLDTGDYQQVIRQTYADKYGLQSTFVFWSLLTEELLDLALHCIPASHLKHWCQRILSDIKNNRNGFPDLIQFWPAEQRYQMIEVKGPGDRLQDNQKRWIAFCAAHGMPVSVCYLAWEDGAV